MMAALYLLVRAFDDPDPRPWKPLLAARGWSVSSISTNADALGAVLIEVRMADRLVAAQSAACQRGENRDILLRLTYPSTSGVRLEVRSAALAELPLGHRQFVEIKTTQGQVLASRLLSAASDRLSVDAPAGAAAPASQPQGFRQFFVLGIEHILTGYDHLLFLFALLLVCASFRAAALVITCFTVAHSLTLGLATFDLVRLPASVVEPTIALTIVYVGLENIFRRDRLRGRWLLTGIFGLVHGLGFASVLRELGIGGAGGGVLVPLVSFNFGVETGQLAIAALVLPVLLSARRRPAFAARWVPASSAFISLAGLWWFLERTVLGG